MTCTRTGNLLKDIRIITMTCTNYPIFRYSTDIQPDANMSESEREALMGIVVRIDTGKTGAVEVWLNLVDQILIKAYMECASKYAEDKGKAYPHNSPIFVNQNLKIWAGDSLKRFPNFSLFEGMV